MTEVAEPVLAAPVLAGHRLERRYGRRVALEPTDFELRRGELVALVGPNGAGKSTLLALLAGALPPSGGRVERREPLRVGWAPQRPAVYGHLSAAENAELFARLERLYDPQGAAAEVLRLVGLDRADQLAAELSVGNQQRLNLALALLGDPDVLLLDEPSASLDPAQTGRLWELLLTRRGAGGAALLATHSLEEATRLATRTMLLVDGSVVLEGGAAEVAAAMAAS
jgi:ABC-2 type transport system ATP-binding protein